LKGEKILLSRHSKLSGNPVNLPASKSISNRALIVNYLSEKPDVIDNLSAARDTQTLNRLLQSNDEVLDVLDAGTTMRFLTAYLTVTNQNKILTGTERMCQRPIGILVDALREIGAQIEYQKADGFPPLQIIGLNTQTNSKIAIQGDVSSQYISALLMIAPILPKGLTLELTGHIGSRPYIDMTLKIMEHYGVTANWNENFIKVEPQPYKTKPLTVEPDWSGASYWYSLLALSDSESLDIVDLKDKSLQGDRAMANIMLELGVETTFTTEGASLKKIAPKQETIIDFTHCPDLAQTVAVTCAAKGITCKMTGLESLRIKETDRILALQNELSKIGAELQEHNNEWKLVPSQKLPDSVSINTYDDHRMAMAFAPLATLMNVTIEDSSVVNKSFPTFWEEMERAGFKISPLQSV